MKCIQTLAGYCVIAIAAGISAFKGTLDWMSMAVLGGIMIPACRRWIVKITGFLRGK